MMRPRHPWFLEAIVRARDALPRALLAASCGLGACSPTGSELEEMRGTKSALSPQAVAAVNGPTAALAPNRVGQPQPIVNAGGTELRPGDVRAYDYFGRSVSMHGSIALIGAPLAFGRRQETGTAYVFERQAAAWSTVAEVMAADGVRGDGFGFAVSVRAGALLVGAHRDDDNGDASGSAYIFERDGAGWPLSAKIRANDAAAGDRFGEAVAMGSGVAVVGAPWHSSLADRAGAAYVFERSASGWQEVAKLQGGDLAATDQFGMSVAIDGDRILVGAPYHSVGDTWTGAAYVFERNATSWPQTAQLAADVPVAYARLGWSLALDGERALIGAPQESGFLAWAGSAYLFARSGGGWAQTARFVASDIASDDRFGRSVSLRGSVAIIGAFLGGGGVGNIGAAYVYQEVGGQWTQETRLGASSPNPDAWFGESVAQSGGQAIVGASYDRAAGINAGTAYVFGLGGLGVSCSEDLDCSSGSCVAGLCCDRVCDGGCERCDAADALGQCQVVALGMPSAACAPYVCHGLGSCPQSCQGDRDCAVDHRCVDRACIAKSVLGDSCGKGVECASGHCVAGLCCDSVCDGGCERCDRVASEGSCQTVEREQGGAASCGAYRCDGVDGMCPTTCENHADCSEESHCAGENCQPDLSGGQACSEAEVCGTGHCADGLCCKSADCGAYRCGAAGSCDEACTSNRQCAEGYGCGSDGACLPTPKETASSTEVGSCALGGAAAPLGGRRAPSEAPFGLAMLGALAWVRRWRIAG